MDMILGGDVTVPVRMLGKNAWVDTLEELGDVGETCNGALLGVTICSVEMSCSVVRGRETGLSSGASVAIINDLIKSSQRQNLHMLLYMDYGMRV